MEDGPWLGQPPRFDTTVADQVKLHHERHGDRVGADSRYIEICWICAEEFVAYIEAHPDENPLVAGMTFAMALRPTEDP